MCTSGCGLGEGAWLALQLHCSLSSLPTGWKADPVDKLVCHLAHAKEGSALRKMEVGRKGCPAPRGHHNKLDGCDQPRDMRKQ